MFKITVLPDNKKILAKGGENLAEVLSKAGYDVLAFCGGMGSCGKCKVKLISGNFNRATKNANDEILSCKAEVCSDAVIFFEKISGSGLIEFNDLNLTASGNGLGVALDIGTTTLAFALVNLKTGKVLKKLSCLNPQSVYGADVLSRILACKNGNLEHLHKLIIEKTDEVINTLANGESIQSLTVSANTTMLHIFAGVSPESMGVAPFTPKFLQTQIFSGEQLGLPVKNVTLLPSASAYVGADVVAGVNYCELQKNKVGLLIDIGTNGEIVLAKEGNLYAVSTAAGPALEGACIECGTGGILGAIDKVFIQNEKLNFTTVNNQNPVGICGSGIIDAIALMLKEGVIDESGRFAEDYRGALCDKIKDDAFYITQNVYISQKDVRQFQLAKSAIRAGLETLLKACNICFSEVESLFVSGGIGFYMNADNASIAGLIPKELVKKVKILGNSALAGALLCAVDNTALKRVETLSERIQIIDLATDKNFTSLFAEYMLF